jgi:hypothetical protein
MATQYRYLFADLRTNAILAELPLTGVTFSQVLNSPGALNARLMISDVRENQYDIQGSTIPARTALYVDRDGVLVWGGIVWLRRYDSQTQTIDLTAREFDSYWENRRIAVSDAFTNVDQLTVVQDLINTAQSASGGDIGIIVPTNTSGILVTRVFYGYELKDLYGAIKDLSTSDQGFDFNVDVSYDVTNTPIKKLDLGYPARGKTYSPTDPSALVFEFPGNLVAYEYPEDGMTTANVMYGIGPGSNEGKLIATASIPGQIAAGWPLLEDSASYNDTYDATLLGNITQAEVLAKRIPIATVKIVIPAYQAPVLGTYKTGDQCLLRITDVRFPSSGSGYGLAVVKRIVAINVEPGEAGPERVTLTLADLT